MDIERAKVVVQVADAITATAKVEVDAMKITGGTGSGFIPDGTPKLPGPRAAAPLASVGSNISKGK